MPKKKKKATSSKKKSTAKSKQSSARPLRIIMSLAILLVLVVVIAISGMNADRENQPDTVEDQGTPIEELVSLINPIQYCESFNELDESEQEDCWQTPSNIQSAYNPAKQSGVFSFLEGATSFDVVSTTHDSSHVVSFERGKYEVRFLGSKSFSPFYSINQDIAGLPIIVRPLNSDKGNLYLSVVELQGDGVVSERMILVDENVSDVDAEVVLSSPSIVYRMDYIDDRGEALEVFFEYEQDRDTLDPVLDPQLAVDVYPNISVDGYRSRTQVSGADTAVDQMVASMRGVQSARYRNTFEVLPVYGDIMPSLSDFSESSEIEAQTLLQSPAEVFDASLPDQSVLSQSGATSLLARACTVDAEEKVCSGLVSVALLDGVADTSSVAYSNPELFVTAVDMLAGSPSVLLQVAHPQVVQDDINVSLSWGVLYEGQERPVRLKNRIDAVDGALGRFVYTMRLADNDIDQAGRYWVESCLLPDASEGSVNEGSALCDTVVFDVLIDHSDTTALRGLFSIAHAQGNIEEGTTKPRSNLRPKVRTDEVFDITDRSAKVRSTVLDEGNGIRSASSWFLFPGSRVGGSRDSSAAEGEQYTSWSRNHLPPVTDVSVQALLQDTYLYYDTGDLLYFRTLRDPDNIVPVTATYDAEDITSSGAMLKGEVLEPGNGEAWPYFMYGFIPGAWLGSGPHTTEPRLMAERVSNLEDGITVQFRACVEDVDEENGCGDIKEFTTVDEGDTKPVADTRSPRNITDRSMVLQGHHSDRGDHPSIHYFEWDEAGKYNNPKRTFDGMDFRRSRTQAASLTNLESSTTYWYRFCVEDKDGDKDCGDTILVDDNGPRVIDPMDPDNNPDNDPDTEQPTNTEPEAETRDADLITDSSFRMNGYVIESGNKPSEGLFRVTDKGPDLSSGFEVVNASSILSNDMQVHINYQGDSDTTYWYQFCITDVDGDADCGDSTTVTTHTNEEPEVRTLSAMPSRVQTDTYILIGQLINEGVGVKDVYFYKREWFSTFFGGFFGWQEKVNSPDMPAEGDNFEANMSVDIGKRYRFQACVLDNSNDQECGEWREFTAQETGPDGSNNQPRIENKPAESVTASSFQAVARLTQLGDPDTLVYFKYGTDQNDLDSEEVASSFSSLPGSDVSKQLTGLDSDTTYYYQACARDTDGDEFCDTDTESATTLDDDTQTAEPVIRTMTAIDITSTSFIARTEILDAGDEPVTTSLVYWPTNDQNQDQTIQTGSWDNTQIPRVLETSIQNLRPNTEYSYRAIGIDLDGDVDQGDVQTTRTAEVVNQLPVVRLDVEPEELPLVGGDVVVRWEVDNVDQCELVTDPQDVRDQFDADVDFSEDDFETVFVDETTEFRLGCIDDSGQVIDSSELVCVGLILDGVCEELLQPNIVED